MLDLPVRLWSNCLALLSGQATLMWNFLPSSRLDRLFMLHRVPLSENFTLWMIK